MRYFSFSFPIHLEKCLQFCVFLSIWGVVCTLIRTKIYINDLSKRLQCNKEWNVQGGLNTSVPLYFTVVIQAPKSCFSYAQNIFLQHNGIWSGSAALSACVNSAVVWSLKGFLLCLHRPFLISPPIPQAEIPQMESPQSFQFPRKSCSQVNKMEEFQLLDLINYEKHSSFLRQIVLQFVVYII